MIQIIKNFKIFCQKFKTKKFSLLVLLTILFSCPILNQSLEASEKINNNLVHFENLRIEDLKINFGKKTTRHFLVMGRLIDQGEILKYNQMNSWKKVKIEYKNKNYEAKMKLHGKNPNNHSKGFIYHSYSVKLKKGQTINGFRKFKIIVDKRFEGSNKVLALSKVMNVLSLPIYPIKVNFNDIYFSQYAFVPRIDKVFSDKLGIGTYSFFNEYEEKNSYKENDLKSFLYNPYTSEFSATETHLKLLIQKLELSLKENYNFSNEFRNQIISRFNDLNYILYENNHEDILEFFEEDYIVRYLITIILSAENGHQNVYANQQIAYDTSTGYFYPFLTWDSQTDINKYISDSNILETAKNYSGDIPIPLMINLIDNQKIRNKLILKLSEIINEIKKNELIDKNLFNQLNEKNYISFLDDQLKSLKTKDFEKNNFDQYLVDLREFGVFEGDYFVFNSGEHIIQKDLILPKNLNVQINPGTTFFLTNKSSIIIYGSLKAEGTNDKKIYIKTYDSNKTFGTFAVIGGPTKKVSIKHLEIENPSEKIINGKYLQGGLSLYNFNDVTIDDLKIKNSEGEDGMNIKNANLCNLKNIFIQNAKFDAIDIDNCNTIAKNIKLENFNTKDDNGDGLDFYFSKASLKNIKIRGFNDKGISIGENSLVDISESLITNNKIGTAIKDDSCLKLLNKNDYNNNEIDISIYNKKNDYGSGTLILNKNQSFNIKSDSKGKIKYNINNNCSRI